MIKFCFYGCGQIAKHQTKSGRHICLPSPNSCPENRKKNSKGLEQAHQSGKRGYTYNPNSAWSKGKTAYSDPRVKANVSYDPDNVFVENSSARNGAIKNILLAENIKSYQCTECGLEDEWNGKPITLELDHINGIRDDNRIKNLRFLCPNCHSQTPTYKGRQNKNKPQIQFTDEQYIEAIQKCDSIEGVCRYLGISPMNRPKVMKVMIERGLTFALK